MKNLKYKAVLNLRTVFKETLDKVISDFIANKKEKLLLWIEDEKSEAFSIWFIDWLFSSFKENKEKNQNTITKKDFIHINSTAKIDINLKKTIFCKKIPKKFCYIKI